MIRKIGNTSVDRDLATVERVLRAYTAAHHNAAVAVRRQNSVSIRVRVVDPDFEGVSRADRDDQIWGILNQLPERVRSQITMLLLLTPDETGKSLANLEFEFPIQSRL